MLLIYHCNRVPLIGWEVMMNLLKGSLGEEAQKGTQLEFCSGVNLSFVEHSLGKRCIKNFAKIVIR